MPPKGKPNDSGGRVSSKGGAASSGRVSSKAGAVASTGRVSSKSGAVASGGKVSSKGTATKAKGVKKADRPYVKLDIDDDEEEYQTKKKSFEPAVEIISSGGASKESTVEDSKKNAKKQRKIEQQLATVTRSSEDAVVTYQGSDSASSSADGESSPEGNDLGDCVKIPTFSLSFRGEELFRDASVTLTRGLRYALVGPNGSGKSTFLRHLADRKLPGIPASLDLLHVEQEVSGTDESALNSVLLADETRLRLIQRKAAIETELDEVEKQQQNGEIDEDTHLARDSELQSQLAGVFEEMAIHGVDSAPGRAANILTGLQFTPEMQQKPTKEFSGGWRMRIALARALFLRPTLLLLDEPTNHLDLHAVIWLQEYLKRWKKTLVLVSHDRAFINEVCNRIVHLDSKKLVTYKGSFDDFLVTYHQKQRELDNVRKKQQQQIKDLNRMKHGDQSKGGGGKKAKGSGAKAKQAIDKKEKQVEQMKKDGLVEKTKEYVVTFPFPSPERQLEHPVIKVEDVSFRYDESGPLVFKDLNFGINMESRVALVGPNGAGKSTLLGLLFGKLKPTSGSVHINHHLRIGYFAQHFADQLEMDVSPVQYLHDLFPDCTYQEIRKALGKFGLPGKMHLQAVSTLSGGQKNRVLFAKLALSKPDILYLDEPTNHLDMESIEALSESVSRDKFEGGVIIVSHDARLIDSVCGDDARPLNDEGEPTGQEGEIWVIAGDTHVRKYDGTIYDYRSDLVEALNTEEIEAAT
jgi:ATP-binding cassette subfamily F protein 1